MVVVTDDTVVAGGAMRSLGLALDVTGVAVSVEVEGCFFKDLCRTLVIILRVEDSFFVHSE